MLYRTMVRQPSEEGELPPSPVRPLQVAQRDRKENASPATRGKQQEDLPANQFVAPGERKTRETSTWRYMTRSSSPAEDERENDSAPRLQEGESLTKCACGRDKVKDNHINCNNANNHLTASLIKEIVNG